MTEKLIKIVSGIFAIIWCIVIFTEYWRYNPNYEKAIEHFQYFDLLIVFLVIGAGTSWGLSKKKDFKYVNGLSIFGGILLVDILTVIFCYGKMDSLKLTLGGLFSHLSIFIGITSAIFIVYLLCRVLGQLFTNIFPLNISTLDLPIIQTVLGTMIVTFAMFFLGVGGGLAPFILIPLALLVLAINWRMTWVVLKNSLFKSIKVNQLNTLGVFSFLFLGLFLTFDFAQILRPFPAGTDSINLYVNLPVLISDYSGLVAGNQPYNWSLFMSLGLVLFGRLDVVLALSFLGGFLALIALFRLSRKWLDINYSALCLLLFFSVPMINFLSYMDMKIDMALLFVSLCILLLLYNYIVPVHSTNTAKQKITPVKYKAKASQSKRPNKKTTVDYSLKAKKFFKSRIPKGLIENRLLIIMGLLAGFGFGIKLTLLFFVFALVTAIWYAKGGIIAFLSAFFLALGLTFLFQLDAQPQLRQFHESVSVLQWVLLIIGLGLLAYLFVKQKQIILPVLKSSVILGGFFLLPIIPWLGKNYIETQKLSVDALLNGKKSTPVLDLNALEKKLK